MNGKSDEDEDLGEEFYRLNYKLDLAADERFRERVRENRNRRWRHEKDRRDKFQKER